MLKQDKDKLFSKFISFSTDCHAMSAGSWNSLVNYKL